MNHNLIARFFSTLRVDMSKDWYKILNVSQKADPSEIKKSYYQLAKTYHPDINGGSDVRFKDI